MSVKTTPDLRVGTAAWSVPTSHRGQSQNKISVLEHYAQHFNAVEINSSFYRPHRRRTYEKWAGLVSPDFLFSVKIPKQTTHDLRWKNIAEPLKQFAGEVSGLGPKLGCLLVQLPPSLAFCAQDHGTSFALLRQQVACPVICEPRHHTWFETGVDAFLADRGIGRAAVDPTRFPQAATPGGAALACYYRLHGSPEIYHSAYTTLELDSIAKAIMDRTAAPQVWCIFDNTADGHAFHNAMTLQKHFK